MGDGQEWLFPPPPAPGVDRDYDATVRCLEQAEDHADSLRIELALAIHLLSRNYDLSPPEFEEIFRFGSDRMALSEAQAAFSELIGAGLEPERLARAPEYSRFAPEPSDPGALQSWLWSCATRLRSLLS
jgi:hypothetical protein